jgi:hypothetical protein
MSSFRNLKAILAASALAAPTLVAAADCGNDFPTRTRGDYIFACMQINGQNQLALERCACSIDVIASLISHEEYLEAETIMSYRLRGGESTAPMFHQSAKDKVQKLKLAQIEGELKCF